MSDKLYITLAADTEDEIPELVEKLKKAYPDKNWIAKTPIHNIWSEKMENGTIKKIPVKIQKFETQ